MKILRNSFPGVIVLLALAGLYFHSFEPAENVGTTVCEYRADIPCQTKSAPTTITSFKSLDIFLHH